ncbi:MAG: DbpA RNA binding domain-containing protein, partial [Anaerolineales bacterium]|nr:DbpA RNA binding domain-containing protein [Anaerolineales bacterium]
DEMLSMGFIEDIETILSQIPSDHQTALFSATLPAEIRQLADRYLRQPQVVAMRHKQLTVATIEQRYYLVNEADKMAALTRLFEMEAVTSTLIFTRTRVSTGEVANELTVRGFPAEALNGDLSQDTREQVLNRFRNNQINVLVATDVAARGLDIDNISHVINFDLPRHPEVYVHRVGRTGRAGKTGTALTLIAPQELYHLRRIEGYTKQKIARAALPTVEEIQERREAQLLERMMVWLRRGRCNREREMVTELVEEGNDPIEIAAAALKLARAEEKQRPIARIGEVVEPQSRQRERGRRRDDNSERRGNGRSREKGAPHGKSHERGMVRFMLNAGKSHGVRPNDVVGTIAYHADIPGRAIGAIHIQEHHTLVDVPEQFGEQVLAKTGQYRIHRRAITVERA